MHRFTFNTGVKIWNNPHIKGGIDSGNGTVVIPFYCENVPERAIFQYACNSPNLEKDNDNIICREIKDSELTSKYAYFAIGHLQPKLF